MGWRFKAHGILQCTTESVIENVKDQFATEGGCQVRTPPRLEVYACISVCMVVFLYESEYLCMYVYGQDL